MSRSTAAQTMPSANSMLRKRKMLARTMTGITNTNELLFGRPHYELMRGMMTNDAHWPMTKFSSSGWIPAPS